MSSTRCGRHGPTATRRYVRPTPWACPRWRCRTSADRSWVDSLASLGRFPSLRSGGGTTPIPPECRRTGRRQRVAPVRVPGPYADRVKWSPTTYHLPLATYHLPPTTPRLPPHGTPKRARPSSASSGESTENHDRPSSPQECQSTTCSNATTSNRLWSDPPSSSSVRAAAATVGG